MRLVCAAVLAAMLFNSCSNLFHHGIDSVDPSPVVTGVAPSEKDDPASVNTLILVYFSTKMNLATINYETIIVEKVDEIEDKTISKTLINGNVDSFNENFGIATFSLSAGELFEIHQKYTVTVKRGVRSAFGKILEDDFVSTFITGNAEDSISPTLDSVSPEYLANKDNFFMGFDLFLYFSEPINPGCLSDLTITLTNQETGANFDFSNDSLIIDQNKPSCICVNAKFKKGLTTPAAYQVTIEPLSSIKDLSGNMLSVPDDFLIKLFRVYDHPYRSPCWMPGEGSPCEN